MFNKSRNYGSLFLNPKIQLPMIAYIIVMGMAFTFLNLFASQQILDNVSAALASYQDDILKVQISNIVYLIVWSGIIINIFFIFLSSTYVLIWGHRFLGAQQALVKIVRDRFLNNNFEEPVKIRENYYLYEMATALEEFRVKQSQTKP